MAKHVSKSDMMKKLALTIGLAAALGAAQAQFQVNPQFGATYQHLTGEEPGMAYKGAYGWQVGLDLRFGDRVFFQPGAFFGQNATTVRLENNSEQFIEDDIIRTNLTMRGLVGYKIVDKDLFDMRIMAGPSYDVLLSADDRHDNIGWNKGNFSNGSFNLDAALGFDMGWFTVQPGVSFGLSNAFKESNDFGDLSSKYLTYGLTIGLNLGNDD